MYSCGRMLYALAKPSALPTAMAKVSVTAYRLRVVSIAIPLIGSCLNYIIPNPQRVFVWPSTVPACFRGWCQRFAILISQLRFRRAYKAAIASHPFRSTCSRGPTT
ncbi:hypothetical protein MJ572_19640 [Escherichia coli]|nr:hypothetical protein MJ572_19640 [Escherichia coli]